MEGRDRSVTPITTKAEFYRLWHRGSLGNKLRTWAHPDHVPASYTGSLMLRPMNSPGGSASIVELPVKKALDFWRWSIERGLTKRFANECAPDSEAVFQGEVMRDVGRLYLLGHYREYKPGAKLMRMRDALKQAKEYRGLAAEFMLRKVSVPASRDDVLELLDLYPDHVIEFTAYRRCVGNCQQRNVIIWEVRKY